MEDARYVRITHTTLRDSCRRDEVLQYNHDLWQAKQRVHLGRTVGCGDEGTASFAIDTFVPSPHFASLLLRGAQHGIIRYDQIVPTQGPEEVL